jgi:hypothetical protein
VANGGPTRGIVCLDCSRPQGAARAAAAIVGVAQSVEHYEIALIGETLCNQDEADRQLGFL